MKKISIFLFLVALLAACGPARADDGVFEKAMKGNTLRCGYWDWRPLYWRDANTQKPQGIFFDVMKEIGRVSKIDVTWTHEIQFAQFISDLRTRKIDAVCAGIWPSALRAREVLFTEPVFYIPVNAYVREGDKRFDNRLPSLDAESVRVAVMDGEMSYEIKNADFPKSTAVAIPQIAGAGTELLMMVAAGKADVTFVDAVAGYEFTSANPGKVRLVRSKYPVRVLPNTLVVDGGEARLKFFLDEAIRQLHGSGTIEAILEKYDAQFPGVLMRAALPYKPEN